MRPSPAFLHSVAANLDYWRQRTQNLPESQFSELQADWPNLVRAVNFSLDLPPLWAPTSDLALQMFEFVERRAHWRDWINVLERVRAAAASQPQPLSWKLLDHLGYLYRLDWQIPAAVEAHRAAEALALEAGDQAGVAHARFNLCEDYRYQRDYTPAEALGQSALEIFQALAAPEAQRAAVLNALGLIAHARGESALACTRLEHALELYRRLDRPTDLARVLKNQALALEGCGQKDAALQHYLESRQILDGTTSELDKVQLELSVGTLYFNQGRLAEAEAAFQRADSPYLKQSGITYYQALTANNLGNVFLGQGRLTEAEAALRHSLALWRATTDGLMLANTLGTLGELLAQQGQAAAAIPFYEEAVTLLANYPEDAWGCRLLAKFTAQRNGLAAAG